MAFAEICTVPLFQFSQLPGVTSSLKANEFCWTSFKVISMWQYKKSELMLMRRATAYSSSCLQVVLVYLYPFRCNSLFCKKKIAKKAQKNIYF